MPTIPGEYAQEPQEQTLKTIRQGQQAVLEGVRAWLEDPRLPERHGGRDSHLGQRSGATPD
jgi:hypothetical protein